MEKGSINSGFNYLNNNSDKAIMGGAPVLDNVATFTSILTNPELSVVLHMLSSKQNTDLLSAPKVVSQAGTPATIKVVTEYIYPTEYDVEMLESTTGDNDTTTYSGAVVEPQNFQMREVGVILEVTPDVTPDGSMINLALAPSVVSEPTWKNYGSTYPVSTATGTDLLGNQTFQTEYVQLPMEQPFFPVRSVATSVQIYTGATVVMGGMITEERYTNEDKIPFLGDIPVIGELFRYKYDLSEKRNLLLFVTARLVDPAGREVKDSTNDGMALLTEGQ
jgi:general secretion pathway protein D